MNVRAGAASGAVVIVMVFPEPGAGACIRHRDPPDRAASDRAEIPQRDRAHRDPGAVERDEIGVEIVGLADGIDRADVHDVENAQLLQRHERRQPNHVAVVEVGGGVAVGREPVASSTNAGGADAARFRAALETRQVIEGRVERPM